MQILGRTDPSLAPDFVAILRNSGPRTTPLPGWHRSLYQQFMGDRVGVCEQALRRVPPLREVARTASASQLTLDLVVLVDEDATVRDRHRPIHSSGRQTIHLRDPTPTRTRPQTPGRRPGWGASPASARGPVGPVLSRGCTPADVPRVLAGVFVVSAGARGWSLLRRRPGWRPGSREIGCGFGTRRRSCPWCS